MGVMVGAPTGDDHPFGSPGLSIHTMHVGIFHEWNTARAGSAWDALLLAQDTLRPNLLSVPPSFILSVMALAKVAAHEIGVGRNAVARWLPNIALADRVLTPLIEQMMTAWLAGPSKAATRYRARTRVRAATPAQSQMRLFPQPAWAGVLTAERPEPFIMRLLHATQPCPLA